MQVHFWFLGLFALSAARAPFYVAPAAHSRRVNSFRPVAHGMRSGGPYDPFPDSPKFNKCASLGSPCKIATDCCIGVCSADSKCAVLEMIDNSRRARVIERYTY